MAKGAVNPLLVVTRGRVELRYRREGRCLNRLTNGP